MHPPSLINGGSFPSANASSYGLTEIWPFPLNGGGVGGVLGLRSNHLAGYVETRGTGIVNRDVSVDESTITEQSGSRGGARRKRRDATSEDESSKLVSTSSDNDMQKNSGGKRQKVSGSGDENGDSKADVGQATDSHSLAERARREKISETMKILQDLVPGVIGKALVLDEIINHIQSLQRQVEFLSMKLEAVNSKISPGIEGFPPKDVKTEALCRENVLRGLGEEFGAQTFDTTAMAFNSQAAREYVQGSPQEWLHMQHLAWSYFFVYMRELKLKIRAASISLC
ncbi:hypothetical protein NE237_020862 [Protea cynaroides]|uniref:BHLH domain-containing protein n=1 Tax=Protea cynaroides TaxID=273540 RepID=A0A9Q0H6W9_9MAGN|nr:hypothetical protein NE237_020862 [Protea cynaroides]